MLPWLQRKERDSAYLSRLLLLVRAVRSPCRAARKYMQYAGENRKIFVMKKKTRMKHTTKGLTHTIRSGGIVHMFLAYTADDPYEEGELIEYRERSRKEAKKIFCALKTQYAIGWICEIFRKEMKFTFQKASGEAILRKMENGSLRLDMTIAAIQG